MTEEFSSKHNTELYNYIKVRPIDTYVTGAPGINVGTHSSIESISPVPHSSQLTVKMTGIF